MTAPSLSPSTPGNFRIRFLLILLLSGVLNVLPLAGYASPKEDFDPGTTGTPGGREDGGSRDPRVASRLIALTPLSGQAQTLASHPTFWAHIPADQGWVMLRLQDATSQEPVGPVVAFPVADGPGLMGFSWPASLPALEVDRRYRWTLTYCCSEKLVRSQLEVSGEVVRHSGEDFEAENGLNPSLPWLIEQGFWLDAMAIAVRQRQQYPLGAQAQWREVLTHPEMALERLLNAPISRCCSVNGR